MIIKNWNKTNKKSLWLLVIKEFSERRTATTAIVISDAIKSWIILIFTDLIQSVSFGATACVDHRS